MADKCSLPSSVTNEPTKTSSGERSSHINMDKKGKAPAKGKQKVKSLTQSTSSGVREKDVQITESENVLLTAIAAIQVSINKQSEKMNSQQKQIQELSAKMASYDDEDCYYEYDAEYQYEQNNSEPCISAQFDAQAEDEHADSECPGDKSPKKRPLEVDENNNSRFSDMSKRFKATECCSDAVEPVLAKNVTDLFRCGIDDLRYNDLVKDESTPRPSNCEGLVTVQTNPLIWDSLSPVARSTDKKMQNIESSVIKSATKLVKVVDSMAKLENELKNDKFNSLIDECNDALALLGQANKQINLARKDFLRPELNREYSHLCNHSRPVTHLLFGDDVSKSAKEIEDVSKISSRMFSNRNDRGGFPGRRRARPRFRGGRGFPRGRGPRGYYHQQSRDEGYGYQFGPGSSNAAKNSQQRGRRGSRPYYQ